MVLAFTKITPPCCVPRTPLGEQRWNGSQIVGDQCETIHTGRPQHKDIRLAGECPLTPAVDALDWDARTAQRHLFRNDGRDLLVKEQREHQDADVELSALR